MTETSFGSRLERLIESDRPGVESAEILSDLSRAERTQVGSMWPRIPDEMRRTIVAEASLLAESNVSFDFERLMLIALEDTDHLVRQMAAAALEETTSREVVRSIGERLIGDEDEDVRAAAAEALARTVADWDGRKGFERAHQELLDLLRAASTRDPSEQVRACALVSAAAAPRPWLRPLLEDAYYGESRHLRLAALRAMGTTCDEAWLEYVTEQFESDDPDFRVEAARACGEMCSDEAVEPLAALAGDDDPSVMLAAICAMAQIGGQLALEVMNDLRDDPPPGVDMEVLVAAIEEVQESLTPLGSWEEDS